MVFSEPPFVLLLCLQFFARCWHEPFLQTATASDKPLPIKWTAPESLVEGTFTKGSDAWAFGVFLVELTTNGQQPYPFMTNEAVRVAIISGVYRHPRLPEIPVDVYDLMQRCWFQVCPFLSLSSKTVEIATFCTGALSWQMGCCCRIQTNDHHWVQSRRNLRHLRRCMSWVTCDQHQGACCSENIAFPLTYQ